MTETSSNHLVSNFVTRCV